MDPTRYLVWKQFTLEQAQHEIDFSPFYMVIDLEKVQKRFSSYVTTLAANMHIQAQNAQTMPCEPKLETDSVIYRLNARIQAVEQHVALPEERQFKKCKPE